MKIPLSWLKDYLTFNCSAKEIADILTLAGIEVDAVKALPLAFDGVVVGEVRAAAPHPNADRLKIATVFDGKEELQVVCAAPNCRSGIKVALARIGATLEGEGGKPHKIKKGKLRDVESFGMLCAAEELKLGGKEEGILELPETFVVGTDLAEYYAETIFEISLTPNLGHCLSLLGIARELAAQLQIKVKKPETQVKEDSTLPIEKLIQVTIEDKTQCNRYACRIVKNVKVGPSPDWMQRRLESAGIRSINNLVDISNYVMLEYGQPLHIFDYDALRGKQIIVASKTPYPAMTTLDGVLREIPEGTLMISDAEGPIAFAGVIGGEDSAVTATTTTILIEAAHFSPAAIRRSSKKLDLRTDSSHRFERGVDHQTLPDVLDRAAYLVQEIAGGNVATGQINRETAAFVPTKILCRTERVNQLLGTRLSTGEIGGFFKRLEMQITKQADNCLEVIVPSYRNDLKTEIDLVEEVARIYGYNNIELKPPRYTSSNMDNAPIYLFEREVRELLVRSGLQELHTCDLISPTMAQLTLERTLSKESLIHVLHPSSIDQSVLRITLLPGLLEVVKNNFNQQTFTINGFEVGRIHFKERNQFLEPSMAAILQTGTSTPYHWNPKPRAVDFFDLKGKAESFLQGLGIENFYFEPAHLHNFHPGRQARIRCGEIFVGALGEVHPTLLRTLDIKERVYFAEFNLQDLYALRKKQSRVKELSLYPGSERDWTLTLDEELPIDTFLNAVKEVPSRLLEKIYLLDLYKSEQIGKDKKNATFRFLYRDKEKTIALETVEREHARITQEVAKKLKII
jgi:phenylalanyl-tRNA synthetase beta chain